ncbi:MAG: mechanosensitive ion channel [Syntrophotaleaceae bacterium]
MKILSSKSWGMLLLLLLIPALLYSAETVEPPEPQTLPGAAEIIPRLGLLNEQLSSLNSRLGGLGETEYFAKQLETVSQVQQKLSEGIAQFESDGWSFDRLLAGREHGVEQKNNLAKLLDTISGRLIELDGLRQSWQEQEGFWKEWRQAGLPGLLKDQKEAFSKATDTIETVLLQIKEAGKPLVALQNEVFQLQEQNQLSLGKIDEMLQVMRGKTFEKTDSSFTSPKFFRQFNRDLINEARKNLHQVTRLDRDFFRLKGWVVILQFLLATGLTCFIAFRRKRPQVSEEWQFIIQHPLATGVFVAVAMLGPLYGAVPGLWRLLMMFLAAFSSAILVSGLLKCRCKIFMVYLMATLLVISTALQVVALPTPLYRLYLALLSLGGIPFLLLLAIRYRKNLRGRTDGFILALRLGAAILVLAFIAQFGGFTNLSSRLFESSNKTVFLGLFAAMTVRLCRGGIDYLFSQPFFRRQSFFQQFGDELHAQLEKIFDVFIVVIAFLYLLVVWGWGVFESVGEAWSVLMQLGVTLGETRVTLHMLLIAGVALYAAVQVSWLLRAVLETEFFPRSALDRGIRDSIKKLLHYSIVLVGVVLGLSLMGVTPENFVVLAGAFGIGIGFGLQNIVNNFVSGLILLFERPIKVGDMVMVENEWAYVRKIGLRSTTIETFDLSEIIVPNSDLISQKVTNWTLSSEQSRVVVPVGVAYGSDVPLVLNILRECAGRHGKVLATPQPSVIFTSFGSSSLDFELRVWVADINSRLLVKSDLLQAIDQEFRRAGVEIPFPQRDLHLRSIDAKALDGLGGTKQSTE